MGLGEHASVAAFARFILHLLSLGAPPELLRAAIRAMDDEVEHARLCFGIARRFNGKAAGPGPMDLSRIFGADDPSSILRAAILEGCLEETISARVAQVALDRVKDEGIRAAVTRIVADELMHAELSWRFVAWMLQTHPELKPLAAECFARALNDSGVLAEGDEDPLFEQYGHLMASSKRRVRETTLLKEIIPRTVALLGHDLRITGAASCLM
jgi:hypothetical protein